MKTTLQMTSTATIMQLLSRATRRDVLKGALGSGLLIATHQASAEAPDKTNVVATSSGKVRGIRTKGVSVFLGIPYGTDTGTHRFQPASAAQPWTGVLECLATGHRAAQMEFNSSSVAGPNANLSSPFIKEVMTRFREGMEVG